METLKGDKEVISKAIENARGLSSSGTSTATVQLIGQPTQRSDEHIQAVAGAVKEIVLEIINTDDTGQLCFSHLVSANKPSDLTAVCAVPQRP